jgi:hypothetical protein
MSSAGLVALLAQCSAAAIDRRIASWALRRCPRQAIAQQWVKLLNPQPRDVAHAGMSRHECLLQIYTDEASALASSNERAANGGFDPATVGLHGSQHVCQNPNGAPIV